MIKKKKMQCPKAASGKCGCVSCEHFKPHVYIKRSSANNDTGCSTDIMDCTPCKHVRVKRPLKFPHNVLDKMPEAQLRELVKSIVDIFYLEVSDKKRSYNPDKEWDGNTVELVAGQIEDAGLKP